MPTLTDFSYSPAEIANQAAAETERRYQKAELDHCTSDASYWINNYAWTFDPRKPVGQKDLHFRLYPFQEKLLDDIEDCIDKPEDCLLEKSRDMGVSWLSLAILLHRWLFIPGFQALIGSRKEDLVDNNEADSLFWKLEYMLRHLPVWMLPEGFEWQKHRLYMKLHNPSNGAAIIGESSNAEFSRQGRYTVILMDEGDFWPFLSAAWRASADSALCRLIVSTPNPYGSGYFKELRNSGRIRVITVHWTLHPSKDIGWYNQQKARRTDEDIASELDISYNRGLKGRVYPEWQEVKAGDFPYQHDWPLYISWDFGLDGTAPIWWQRNPQNGLWRIVDSYMNTDRTISWYTPLITGLLPSDSDYPEEALRRINEHRGWLPAVHFGDPDVNKRSLITGSSTREELEKHGIYVQTNTAANSFEERWPRTKLFLRRVEGFHSEYCQALSEAMFSARFPERNPQSQATSENTKPIHDWTSHFRTSVEYMAVNEPQLAARSVPRRRGSAWQKI